MRRILLIILLQFGWIHPLKAFHIAGGDLTSVHLGGNDFQIQLTLFRDCSNPSAAPFDPRIIIGVFLRNSNALYDTFHVDLSNTFPLALAGNGCSPPPEVCMQQGDYTRIIQLPPQPGGYYLVWERCCRNTTITNLASPDLTGMGFYHELADPALANSSPVFNSAPLPYICAGQYFNFNFEATDADGDQLVYELSNPLAGGHTFNFSPNPFSSPLGSTGGQNLAPEPAPYTDATWASGFSLSNICASATPITIDPQTGIVEGIPDQIGFYAMAVTVREFRNGVQIGLVRREIEFTVIPCASNTSPDLDPEIIIPTSNQITIYAGDTLCFTVSAGDADGDSVFLKATGDIFAQSASTQLDPPYASWTDVSGIDSIGSQFCWYTSCSQRSDSLLRLTIEVSDNGCPLPKRELLRFRIRLLPVPVINPPNFLCLEMSDSNTVKLTRAPQPEIIPRYFDRFILLRSIDGSPFSEIGTYSDPAQEIYMDSVALQNNVRDYCYCMKGVNTCGEEGFLSDTICTLSSRNRDLNYIESVSVDSKNRISVTWEDFPDGQYGIYILERKMNEPGSRFEEITRLTGYTDYIWYDEDVFTDRYSYCYRMRNINYCGNESPYSNEGCSILLQGDDSQFSNSLRWNEYREWKGEVEAYRIERNANLDENNLVPLLDLNALRRDFEDRDIPLSGGPFRYRIRAFEGPGGNNAISLSNEVELVQGPLLYLPNAFSPNGDGLNTTWGPGFSYVKAFDITVMNRWGQVVFRTDKPDERWDGRYAGADCEQGVYVYRVRYWGFDKPESIVKIGTLTIVR